MKLFHKIFLCFVIFFCITFQAAGYLLINFTYENVMEQQKQTAFQDFQYNRYILQSMLYTNPTFFERKENHYRNIFKNFTVPVSLYGDTYIEGIDMLMCTSGNWYNDLDWDSRYICEKESERPFFKFAFMEKIEEEKISFQIYEKDEKCYIFVFGGVSQNNTDIYLVTQTDISSATAMQKSMITHFQQIYIVILCISFLIIFFLTKALTSPIRKVREAAGRIAHGNYSQRIHTKGKDEVGELASDFNQMAKQVEDKIAALSDMVRQKEDFTANFAHELKTPMTSVIGYADMLYQRDLPRAEVKSAAGYILDEGMRLEALSLKLMDLFVIDKQDFLLEEMSVPEMFVNMRQGIEPLCGKYGASLHMKMEDGMIRVDFDLFKTMILNLADNSVKAGCKDLWITGEQNGNCYQIKIADNGRGIPKEELGRITEAFYMVDKSRSRKQHGAGLGMALVAKIAEIHGAALKIESDENTGTAVRVSFALAEGGNDEKNL